MPPTPDEQAALDRFATIYRHGQSDFMLDIERSVCGCDYGGTSWTTQEEADKTIDRLKLKPGVQLLDIGSGSGWPGLYLAKHSGCNVLLTDLPFDGLRIARDRAADDHLGRNCQIVCADGAALPFRTDRFDAIYHSDVLCCLVEKQSVLKSCRAVIHPSGKMLFTVIFVAPGLSAIEQQQAIAGGPPFVDAPASYPDMLHEAGWDIADQVDLTEDYLEAVRRHVVGLESHAHEIAEAFGDEEASDMLDRRHRTVSALENGLLRRALFETLSAA